MHSNNISKIISVLEGDKDYEENKTKITRIAG